MSSVLQYLENPYVFLKEVLEKNFKYILIDRTPFVYGKDRLTIQKVNSKIYKASYSAWFFNEKSFREIFSGEYSLIDEFDTLDCSNISSKFKALLYVKNGT